MLAPRTTVIVNPKSQGGRLGKRWRDVAETLVRAFPFDEAITEGPGDATRLAREALRAGAERVVAIGGDGTINEVMNGFFENGVAIAPDATFAIIPYGTGGDFRKTARIPNDVADAAKLIAENHRQKIDVGRLTFMTHAGGHAIRMFINIASFGASGAVDKRVNESGKKLGSTLSFLISAVRATAAYTNQRVQMVFDGTDRVDLTTYTVAVANGKYFGGGMKVAPGAELDDGVFEVMCAGDFSKAELAMKAVQRIYRGTHHTLDKVSFRRAKVVEAEPIDPNEVVELDVDGENPGKLPAKFEIVPSALWINVPPA